MNLLTEGSMDTSSFSPVARGLDTPAAPSLPDRAAPELLRIDAACEQACRSIAPAWPLDQSIAVNPHWGRIDRPVRQVAARMAVLAGVRVFPPRPYVRQAWEDGRITRADLAEAIASLPKADAAGLNERRCLDALHRAPGVARLPLLIDVLDDDPRRHARLSWRAAITHQVSQACAAYFDEQQADWQPERKSGLYAFWRETIMHDHGIGVLMGLPDLGRKLHALPASRQDAERWVMQRLGLPQEVWADYLEAVLLTVNGWASWCAYLGWQARLAGAEDPQHLRELLAVRLAWGAVLLECKSRSAARAFAELQSGWRCAGDRLRQAEVALQVDEIWQLALEAGYQRRLACKLGQAAGPRQAASQDDGAEVQAVFCIDVRSEPLRRALEASWPAIRTIGFAGFFGLPLAYTPLATTARRPQLPGLLLPSLEVTECIAEAAGCESRSQHLTAAARTARQQRFAWAEQWLAGSRWPSAAYSFVEAAGIGYLAGLARWLAPSAAKRASTDLAGLPTRYRAICRPTLAGLDAGARAALAARVLHAMGLDRHLAPLVLLVGHGSQSANNAHAAALDCGACCGQSGEVNARVLAQLLNEPAVRAGLADMGIKVPAQTVFVAALHNTTTDEIEGYDLDLLPPDARARWDRLVPVFSQAGDRVRRERAARLGLDPRAGQAPLLARMRSRANDGAQNRPEWGLAGNAAFIIAPRHRTQGVTLDGRSFLHDYDAASDPDASVLELLMTAPMLVTHWINWQYHASTCDPERLGSGNKILHNVVGGRIGVFEGNGGDLRIGLSRQSLHDGQRWMHEPLRLTVIIDAPQQAIDKVIAQHAVVQQLLSNRWLHLWRFEADGFSRYAAGGWHPL